MPMAGWSGSNSAEQRLSMPDVSSQARPAAWWGYEPPRVYSGRRLPSLASWRISSHGRASSPIWPQSLSGSATFECAFGLSLPRLRSRRGHLLRLPYEPRFGLIWCSSPGNVPNRRTCHRHKSDGPRLSASCQWTSLQNKPACTSAIEEMRTLANQLALLSSGC